MEHDRLLFRLLGVDARIETKNQDGEKEDGKSTPLAQDFHIHFIHVRPPACLSRDFRLYFPSGIPRKPARRTRLGFQLESALFTNLIRKIMARLYDASLYISRLRFLWPFSGSIPCMAWF